MSTDDHTPSGHTTSGHPDFETLSAHFDGEAPEVAGHVAACAECRLTVRWLRTASDLVATPVPPAPAAVRERTLARAGELFQSTAKDNGEPPEVVGTAPSIARPPESARRPAATAPVPITAGRRGRRGDGSGLWVGFGSAAAVVVAVLIGVSALGGAGGRDETDNFAAGSAEERTTTGLSGGAVQSAGDGTADASTSETVGVVGGVDGGDLGELTDPATFAARARPALTQRQAAPVTPDGAPIAGLAAPPSGPAAATPKAVGTRPCEMETRAARPGLGPVVYFATGEVKGVPVVVLGFDQGSAPSAVTLLALDQREGCRVVLEAAGP